MEQTDKTNSHKLLVSETEIEKIKSEMQFLLSGKITNKNYLKNLQINYVITPVVLMFNCCLSVIKFSLILCPCLGSKLAKLVNLDSREPPAKGRQSP